MMATNARLVIGMGLIAGLLGGVPIARADGPQVDGALAVSYDTGNQYDPGVGLVLRGLMPFGLVHAGIETGIHTAFGDQALYGQETRLWQGWGHGVVMLRQIMPEEHHVGWFAGLGAGATYLGFTAPGPFPGSGRDRLFFSFEVLAGGTFTIDPHWALQLALEYHHALTLGDREHGMGSEAFVELDTQFLLLTFGAIYSS